MVKTNLMKKLLLCSLAIGLLASCNKSKESETTTTKDSTVVATEAPETENDSASMVTAFDPSSIPVTTADVGTFPYVTIPERIEYINGTGGQKEYDETFVPINGAFISVKGPVFDAGIKAKDKQLWSEAYAKDSYAKKITDLGGIKLFDERINKTELDKYDHKLGSTLDYWNEPVQVYALKKKDSTIVYFQLLTNSASGGIRIAEAGELK